MEDMNNFHEVQYFMLTNHLYFISSMISIVDQRKASPQR